MIQTKPNRRLARTVTTAVFSAMLGLAGCSHFHETHQHQHAADGSTAQLTLNNGKKWATDEPLRQGMSRIKALIDPMGAVTPDQRLDPTQAKVIAKGVEGQVAFLISNCKLEPKADAVLHVMIGDMLQGAEALSQPAPKGHGLVLIQRGLQRYPEYFETAGAPR